MIETDTVLVSLNEAQRQAVVTTEGPLLILAGAGSGKTRVITQRIAYLIADQRAEPQEIVAITFTNKAAGEMKQRVERLLGVDAIGARIGTFHALCLRILRRDGGRIGIPSGFQIFDTADQLAVLKSILKDLGIEETQLSPRAILSRISHAKNRLVTWDQFSHRAIAPDTKTVARCYEEYQVRLRKLGGLDFDDLIVETLNLLDSHTDVASRYARACRYLLVDEYQDTNQCQYRLARHLAAQHRNICVVGDENQSVYSWRGADIQNILDFERDYPDTKLIKLEQNYRSTGTILRAAGAVIQNNTRRHEKTLWTENEQGPPIHYHRARDDRDESEVIVRIVGSLLDIFPSGEIAVLYRTNNQSRLIEEALVRAGIPYRIVGSLRFYERKEIKDLLAYLRLLLAPQDDGSFLRAVNTPARGIGDTTLERISALAAAESLSLYAAGEAAVERDLLPPRAASSLKGFFEAMQDLRERPETLVVPLIKALLDVTGFHEHLKKAHPGDHEDRDDNIEALVSAAAEYDEQAPGLGLQGFLDRSSLRSDTDDVKGDTGITLLTAHSAKGLEYSAVVIAGLEEDLFPHVRSREAAEEMEEERRLCYVAITRAKKRLFLTNAVRRRAFGNFIENAPSRFLAEIPQEILTCTASPVWAAAAEASSGGWSGAARFRRGDSGGYRSARGFDDSARGEARAGAFGRRGPGRPGLPDPGGDDFAVGRLVTHPNFGRGKILHKEGAGDSLKLTIRFQERGTKTILMKHTTLVVHD